MNRTPQHFKIYASENLADRRLRQTYHSATQHSLEQRRKAIQNVPEWEDLRTRAHDIKQDVISQLDFYLEQLEAKVIQNGGKVFWARDASEASNYVLKLCRHLKATSVVKSKSMVAEEIGLAAALEKDDIEPIETDLGEFIIQL